MLTHLYARSPGWLLSGVRRALGITQANAHDWLCPALGCRCRS